MAIVGTAYISTKVISSGLSKDIEKSVKDAFNQAKPALKAMGDDVGTEMGDAIGKSSSESIKNAEPELKKAGEGMGRTLGESAGEANKKSLDDSIRDTDWVGMHGPDFKFAGKAIGGIFGKAFSDEHKSSMKGHFSDIASAFGSLGPIMMAQGAALGATFGSALASQAVALISVLGPAIVGIAGVAAGSMVALGAAGAAVLLAFTTASPMLDRFKEVAGAVKEEFGAVGLAIQEELLPRLGEALGMLTAYIPTLETGLAGVGTAVGDVAVQFSTMLTQAENLERVRSILDQSAGVTSWFGAAATNLTQAFIILVNAAMPLTTEFAKWVAQLTFGWGESLKAAEASGKLADFMQRAGDILKQLGGIVGSVGTGLWNIFKNGTDSGQNLLTKIEEIAQKFEDWSSSIAGQNSIKKWFSDGEGTAQTFYDILGQVGTSLGELLTALGDLGAQMAENGSLGLMIGIFTGLLDVLTAIMGIPVLGDIISFGIALAPMIPLITTMVSIFGILTTVFSVMEGVVLALGVAFGISFWWVIAIIAVIVAVIAIIVVAIKHWDDIKAVILAVWEAVLDAMGKAWDVIKGWFDAIVEALKAVGNWFADIFEAIGNVIKNAVEAILNFFEPIIHFFQVVIRTYISAFVAFWTLIFDIIMLPVKIFVGLFILAFQAIMDVFTWLWTHVTGWLSTAWNTLKDLLVGPINWAKDTIKNTIQAVKDVFTGAWTFVSNWISSSWNSLKDKLSGPINSAKDIIMGIWETLKGAGKAVWDVFVNAASGVVSGVKGALNGVIGVINGIIDGINTLINGVNKLPGPDLPTVPKVHTLAKGGVVSPSAFGTLAMIGEGGQHERVEPLDENGLSKRDKALIGKMAGAASVNVRVYVGNQEITDIVRVEQERRDNGTARSLAGGRVLAYGGG